MTKSILPIGGLLITVCLVMLPAVAHADRYEQCRDKAKQYSGYAGAVPAEYEREGGAIEGAVKGAVLGSLVGLVSGSDKSKSAERGAKLGALFGALKKADQNKKRKKNAEKRRRYEVELHACMSARN